MRRVIDPIAHYLRDLVQSVSRQWDQFWFTPADPTLLALIRIATGLMLLYTHAVWGLALDDFFGPKSWLSPALVRAIQSEQYTYSFWWVVPPAAMWYAYGASMLIFACFTIGLWTRVSSVLALATAISYVNRVPASLFGLDQINIMLTLYLAIGSSGQVLSVDRWLIWRKNGKNAPILVPTVAVNLAQRLIQVHMAIIYLFAGLSKLQGPAWWNGEAMWRAFANLEYQSMDMTGLAWYPWMVNAFTHITIIWELSFCVLIWNRLARPLVLLGAVVTHIGIGACLGMWTFGLIMLIGNAAFLPNDRVRQIVEALIPERLVVFLGESAIWAFPHPNASARVSRQPVGGVPRSTAAGRP
jgi:Vitamin K-dependent gamma-carboxylase